jgi:hypothetical protein
MGNIKELTSTEMLEISGGENIAYDIGYALGYYLRQILIIRSVKQLFS